MLDPVVSSALSFCSSHLHSRCHLPFCALETLASVRSHPSSSQHVVSSSCSILGITTCTALLILALAAYTLYLTGTLDYFTFSALSIATAVLHLVSVCVMWVPFFPCVYQELIALYLGSSLASAILVPLHSGFPSRLAGCPASVSCGSLLVLRLLLPLMVSHVMAVIAVCAPYFYPDTSILIVRCSLYNHPSDCCVWFLQLGHP